ncbi:MAG: DNA polymerase III subunit alpha, partial [Pirellulales bacterium]
MFVRSPEEMYAAFPNFEDAVSRTQEIADRVDIQLEKRRFFPVFQCPEALSDVAYLRKLCEAGLIWRYGSAGITDEIRQRLERELGVIEKMGYSSYFLIVWDFVRFAMERGIPSSARGSACGSIVAFALGISHVCPLQFDLLFERFLDENRTEPPDIDIDFCRDRRQEVIDYTKQKYGEANVSQIGTFGTLRAKAAIRDVGRALSVPLARVDAVAKMVPDELNIDLKDSLEKSAELKEAVSGDPQIKELFDIAVQLEGLARSAGTHAAGVVVADRPIGEYVPLQTISGKTDIVTQWDGPTVEKAGFLKMDFLGLRNLTILDKAVKNVKQHRGVDIDPAQLPLDDAQTFALLQRGETKGIFQLESGGMRDLLTKMKPDKFNDIIATSALYRPGPLEGGMVMTYVDVKHGRQPLPKVHPI